MHVGAHLRLDDIAIVVAEAGSTVQLGGPM